MDMINLREAPIVDKAEEGATLFALNPDGTINRISAENVGGSGGGKVAKMTVDLSPIFGEESSSLSLQSLGSGASTRAGFTTTLTATCENMTLDEAYNILDAGEKLDILVTGDTTAYNMGKMTGCAFGYYYGIGNGEKTIGFVTNSVEHDNNYSWTWTADGITTEI